MKIYLDYVQVYAVAASSLDTSISASIGRHKITVNAWDSSGTVFKSAVNFTVGSVALSPTSLTFASQTVGTTSSTQPVKLSNTTSSSISISSIAASGDFAETNTCSSTLAASSSCTISVSFKPTTTGTRTGTLTVTDSAGTQTASLTGTGTNTAGLSNIRHIIFYVLENRSFDSYFALLPEYRAARGFTDPFDGLNLNTTLFDAAGNPIQPYQYQTVCTDDISNSWNDQHLDYDNGQMDLFMKTVAQDMPSSIDPYGERAMGYYGSVDLPYYYALATEFATSDRFFSSVLGPTIPNRMYLFAGTSFGHIRPDTPPSGGWTQPTIFDQMDAAGVSWRYYYQDNSVYLAQWSTWSRDQSKVYPISNYFSALQNESTLPSVIFIERPAVSNLDEHPGNNVQSGAANTANLINALLASPSWASSVFILTYDEAGGLYDHVPPQPMTAPDSIAPMLQSGDQPGDFAHTGLRVPFIILSPWVKPHYVSHTVRDFTSILKLIETRFNVNSLTARDAAADDMTEFFDFSAPALLNPPALPTQPTSGTCSKSLEKAPGH